MLLTPFRRVLRGGFTQWALLYREDADLLQDFSWGVWKHELADRSPLAMRLQSEGDDDEGAEGDEESEEDTSDSPGEDDPVLDDDTGGWLL